MSQAFDFDTVINRHHSQSYKWDSNSDHNMLPMFVADMDFAAAPAIIDALQQRVAHGVFGYGWTGDEYFQALNHWFESRYGLTINPAQVLTVIGVVPALAAIISAVAERSGNPAPGVIVQPPVYHCFYSAIRNQNARVISNPLQLDDNGIYQIDFDDLERKAAAPDTHLMLLCHPHNPSGRVWSRDELQRIGEICQRHNVLLVSDEIHCDLLFPGESHVPFATLSPDFAEHSITLNSPSKTFNLAGLQTANIICANGPWRAAIRKMLQANEVGGIGPLGITSLIAAYQHGAPWLAALNEYLYQNYCFIKDFLQQNLPMLELYPQQATYLAWINCNACGLDSDQLSKRLLDDGNLRISSGNGFLPQPDPAQCYIRLNFACPRSTLLEGLQRLQRIVTPLLPTQK